MGASSEVGDALCPQEVGNRGRKDQKPNGRKGDRDRTEDDKGPQKREQRGIRKTKEGIKERWEEREIRRTFLILPVLTQPLRH